MPKKGKGYKYEKPEKHPMKKMPKKMPMKH